jgi:hypothetical protein
MATLEPPVESLLDAVKRLPPDALAEFTSRLAEWQGTPATGQAGNGERAGGAPESFVLNANRLDRAGHRGAAMDLLYDRIDEMLRSGQFDSLDVVLQRAPVQDLSADVLLALLTATLPARSRLNARPDFFRIAETTLKTRGEYETGLLTGLE